MEHIPYGEAIILYFSTPVRKRLHITKLTTINYKTTYNYKYYYNYKVSYIFNNFKSIHSYTASASSKA